MTRRSRPPLAGLVQLRRCRATGHDVGLYDGVAAGMDTFAGRWQTVCEAHGTITSHRTLALARRFAPVADEWCEACIAERA